MITGTGRSHWVQFQAIQAKIQRRKGPDSYGQSGDQLLLVCKGQSLFLLSHNDDLSSRSALSSLTQPLFPVARYLFLRVSSSVTPQRRSMAWRMMRWGKARACSAGSTDLISRSRSPCMSRKVDEMKSRMLRHLGGMGRIGLDLGTSPHPKSRAIKAQSPFCA